MSLRKATSNGCKFDDYDTKMETTNLFLTNIVSTRIYAVKFFALIGLIMLATHMNFLYRAPPQFLSLAAACSGVISRCGSAIIS